MWQTSRLEKLKQQRETEQLRNEMRRRDMNHFHLLKIPVAIKAPFPVAGWLFSTDFSFEKIRVFSSRFLHAGNEITIELPPEFARSPLCGRVQWCTEYSLEAGGSSRVILSQSYPYRVEIKLQSGSNVYQVNIEDYQLKFRT